MAEADEEGRITRAYGFNPHTQQARTNEEDEDAEEGSLWSTDPIWQADLAAGQSLKDASYHYLVTDHLGVPVLALNKAGEATWKARYEAFGKARIDNASTAQINLRLPGQYFDAETGLHQNWNRDYAPGIGRYVQADPIGLAGGLNVYEYAGGNPTYYIDDSGEIVFAPILVGVFWGAVQEISTQALQNYLNGCGVLNWRSYDWYDVLVSGAFGAVGLPGVVKGVQALRAQAVRTGLRNRSAREMARRKAAKLHNKEIRQLKKNIAMGLWVNYISGLTIVQGIKNLNEDDRECGC